MATDRFNYKRVTDPVHGAIGLSKLEIEVVSTQVFQRLRNVKQLGLAHYVFPGADYSRFSHSLGVCHVASRTLNALQQTGAISLEPRTIQLYRLAALLHDIGHYPFSHAMEEAIANHALSSPSLVEDGVAAAGGDISSTGHDQPPPYYRHEALGKEILRRDRELRGILRSARVDPDKISSIFTRETAGDEAIAPLTNLISSDLDADRIDYLLRTAHHTSLPYGAVDIDYLLTQLQIDDQNRVCLTEKALRTADHFLLCRYFDYLQVAFHKTVAGMEAVLKDVLQALINRGMIQSSGEEVIRSVESGAWCDVDDSFVIHRMRQLLEAGSVSDIEKTKVAAVLKRRPPRLLAEMEFVGPRDTGVNDFRLKLSVVRARLSDWAKQFDVDRDLWYVWNRANLALTKVGAQVPQSRRFERDGPTERLEREEYEQEIRILDARGKQSRPITEIPYSLMNVLSGQALYSLRIFALLPEKPADLRERIETEIKKDLPDIPWK